MGKSKVVISEPKENAGLPPEESAVPKPPDVPETGVESKPPVAEGPVAEPVADGVTEQEANAPSEPAPSASQAVKTKKKSSKKLDVLSDVPLKFKDVSFDKALTAEEKAAKKKAKADAKKGGKKKTKEKKDEEPEAKPDETKDEVGEETAGTQPKVEDYAGGVIIAEAVLKQRSSITTDGKKKKRKKGKKSEEGGEKRKKKSEEGKKEKKVRKAKSGEVSKPPPEPTVDKPPTAPEGEGIKKEGEGEGEGKATTEKPKEVIGEGQEKPEDKEEGKEEKEKTEESKVGQEKSKEKVKGKKGKGKKEKDEGGVKKEKGKKEEGEGDEAGKKKGKGKKEEGEGDEAGKKKEKGKKEKEKKVESEGEAKPEVGEGEEVPKKEEKEEEAKKKKSRTMSLKETPEGMGGTSSKLLDRDKRSSKKLRKKSSVDTEKSVYSIPKVISSVGRSKMTMKSSLYSYYDDSLFSVGEGSSSEELLSKTSEVEKKDRKKKGKGKGKKGKKGKGEKEEAVKEEAPPPPPVVEPPKEEKKEKKKRKKEKEEKPAEEEDDVMAQIMKMKQQADIAAGAAPTEPSVAESKKSKKGKPPKKLSKKDKAKLDAKKAEEARIQAELALQAQQQEERKRQEYLRKYAKEKDKKDVAEQALRLDQLNASNAWIRSMMDFNWGLSSKEKADKEWTQYLKCDGLPDPSNPAQMNTYLHLWELVVQATTPEECSRRTDEVLEILKVLNDFIDDPFNVTERLKRNWLWVRDLCRQAQAENLEATTYRLLRDIDGRLNRIDIPTADYTIVNPNFTLCIWLMVVLATPMYNPRTAQKPRLNIKFPEMGMEVQFPGAIDGQKIAVRGIYLKYDHLSDTCVSFYGPPVPEDYNVDLLGATSKEWYVKMMYKWSKRKRKRIMVEDEQGNMVEGPEEPEPVLGEGELPPTVPFQLLDPTPSEYAISVEDSTYERNRTTICEQIPGEEDKTINLRKFLIIGGIFYLNLFYQPPQPHDKVAFDIRLMRLLMPRQLREVPFAADYEPPAPEDPDNKKTPEELEEDMKRQEVELDKLLLFSIKLPEHVIFLDLPTLCAWDPDVKVWTTQDVYDVKHIEEKNLVMFRTTRFGAFSFAVNRYINFPFQTWEQRPESDGTVTFQLTCAILMVEFNIKRNTVCVTQLQNSPNDALQDIVGTYYKLPKLIRILREGGIDLFPDFDAFCYVESGTLEKHWPSEKHLYRLMGLLSCNFNFTWSRWNLQCGRRNIVMQMREYHLERPKQQNFQTLLVTPLYAVFVDTTEISPSFNDAPIPGMKFCSDLFHLVKATSTMSTKDKVAKGPMHVAKTVGDLLAAMRIHSFS